MGRHYTLTLLRAASAARSKTNGMERRIWITGTMGDDGGSNSLAILVVAVLVANRAVLLPRFIGNDLIVCVAMPWLCFGVITAGHLMTGKRGDG